jgi:multisubunit Na+/H+ antiporter MnhE subunit
MSSVDAIGSSDITKIGVGIIVALIVLGALLSFVITALIGRVVILVVVVVLGIFVWQQRTHVEDRVNSHKCDLNATFFGVHLDAPDRVKQACQQPTS